MPVYYNKVKRQKGEKLIKLMVLAVDFLMSAVALILAYKTRMVLMHGIIYYKHHQVLEMVALGACLFVACVFLSDGYRGRSLLRFRRSFLIISKASFAWLIAAVAIFHFLELYPHASRIFLLLAFLYIIVVVCLGRLFLLNVLRITGAAHSLRQRVIFIDWTPKGKALALSIMKDRWHPYEIVGIAPPPRDSFTMMPDGELDLPVLGSYAEIHTLYSKKLIHIAILSDGKHNEIEAAMIASNCERHLVTFMMIPKGFEILLSSLQVTSISGVPVMGVSELPLERPVNAFSKRVSDVAGATLGLLLSAPVIAIFCLLVHLESPGPVFYTQRRVGRGGREFDIIKIRSMKLDAEKESGARWASKNDDRRLRIGAFMRRWNIDELPQFWNVLAGDMSLVGPRPERPELIVNFLQNIKHYNARHQVMPGITGWAAVNGLRGDTSLQERIYYDLYYMENWSLAMDMQIMIMTFFKYKGAG